MKRRRKQSGAQPDQVTPAGRVKWLLATRWEGNRSAMARDVGATHTAIAKVVTDQQEPGRRLLTKIAATTDISADWLLTGRGSPYTPGAIPVAHRVLSGAPQEHATDLVDEKIEELPDLYTPSRYWLRVQRGEPVVKDPRQKIKMGDLLLLETAREVFPKVSDLWQTLCVIRLTGPELPQFKLAIVDHVGRSEGDPEHLEADVFALEGELIKQTILEESPTGDLLAYSRLVRREKSKGPREFAGTRAVHHLDPALWPVRIKFEDVIAVCILVVRRLAIGSMPASSKESE